MNDKIRLSSTHLSKKFYQNIDFDKFVERKSGRDDLSLFSLFRFFSLQDFLQNF